MKLELKSHRMVIIKKMILATFKFLEEQYFYSPVYKKDDDDIFIESLEIEYVNQEKRRKVGISYTKGDIHNEIRYTFTASIIRIPYVNIEDFFSLDNYLKSDTMNFSTTLINNFNEEEAGKILGQIAIALKEHALNIIDGKEWLNTYYPRKD